MRPYRFLIFLSLLALSGGQAWSQHRLYVCPEPVELAQTGPGPEIYPSTGYPEVNPTPPPSPSGQIPMPGDQSRPVNVPFADKGLPAPPPPRVSGGSPPPGPSGQIPMPGNATQPPNGPFADKGPPIPPPPRVSGGSSPPPSAPPDNQPLIFPPPTVVDPMPNLPPPGPGPVPGGAGYNASGSPAVNGNAGGDISPDDFYRRILGADDCACQDLPWHASVSALFMTREKPAMVSTTILNSNPQQSWGYNDIGWRWGGEIKLGRSFGGGPWGVEGVFWTLDEFRGTGYPPPDPNGYSSPMVLNAVDPATHTPALVVLNTADSANNPTTVQEWVDGSPQHKISRSDDLQNFEINLLRTSLWGGGNPNQPFNLDVLLGARYFRFRDHFVFSSEHGYFDDTGAPSAYYGDWLNLDDAITNNLIGGQIGFNAVYRFAERWKIFLSPKFGVYDNHVNLNYNMYAAGAPGQYWQVSSKTYQPLDYPIRASADTVSFLGQVDLGLDCQIDRRWAVNIGYRLVVATNMGLADGQIPGYGNDTQAIANINRSDSLLLHGAFAGLTFAF